MPRLQPLISSLFARDPSGRAWLPALLAAAPRGRAALGELVDEPGSLEISLAVTGASGRLACFDYSAPPPRELQRWFIDNPDRLTWPDGTEISLGTARLRKALINDDPPGSREKAQDRAREHLATASPFTDEWWRFENVAKLDCALLTDRLVVTIDARGSEPLPAATDWYPQRSELVRYLEAAKQLAQGRAWASLVLSEQPHPDATAEQLAETIDSEAPHLAAAEREQLTAAYLGNLTWNDACDAVDVPSEWV